MADEPAVLGGEPVFHERLSFVRPTMPRFEEDLVAQTREIVDTGQLTKGPRLAEFEAAVAEHLGVEHAVAVSSCTLGLLLTYHGLRLGPGEVIVPSFTFMATVHPLLWAGCVPVFADIDPDTWCIDPASVESLIGERTVGIVAVHNFGNPAAIGELEELARGHGTKLVFDAAHGFGARYDGAPVGRFGDAEVFSLSPTKLLVAGEGGIVATNDGDLARHVRLGREYGNSGDYGSEFEGLNARMGELNALLGLHGLGMLEENVERRNRLADLFRQRLESLPLSFQRVRPEDRCSYKDLSVVIDEEAFGLTREELAAALAKDNVDTRKYHYPPVHTHQTYVRWRDRYGDALPMTDDIAGRSISLPIWSHMDEATVEGICQAIERIAYHAERIRQQSPVVIAP